MLFHFAEVALSEPPQLLQYFNQTSSPSELIPVTQPEIQRNLVVQLPGRVCVVGNRFLNTITVWQIIRSRDNSTGAIVDVPFPSGFIYPGTAGTYVRGSSDIAGLRRVYYIVFDEGTEGWVEPRWLRWGDC